jgi:hypothetical protein
LISKLKERGIIYLFGQQDMIVFSETLPKISVKELDVYLDYFSQPFPTEYKGFLLIQNGGIIDFNKYTYMIDTHIPWINEDGSIRNPNRRLVLYQFYGVNIDKVTSEVEDIIKMNEDFESQNFLPQNVVAFGSTEDGGILAISLNEADYGAVYLWDYYWMYPWSKPHFETKIQEVLKKYPNYKEMGKDKNSPESKKLNNELNYATLTKLASSFSDFINKLEAGKEAAEEELEEKRKEFDK